MNFSQMTINTLAAFIVLFILSRILGKKLISQMTFFDFVAGVSLGSMTGSVMFTKGIPLSIKLYALVLFAACAFILDIIAMKSFRGRKMLNDEPTLIIKNGKILEEGMGKARLNMDQLLFQLRKKNIFYLDDVDIAFFETDGTVSAQKKADKLPPTKKDMQLPSPSRGVAQTFIIDGEILENSLKALGKNQDWVKGILPSFNVSSIKDVAVAQMDEMGTIFIDKRNDSI